MRPTKAWVESTVRLWQARLGLDHWDVVIDWNTTAEEAVGRGNVYAAVRKADDYDTATIFLEEAWRQADREKLEPVLVHELLHLSVRDMRRANDFIFDTLQDETAQEIALAAWRRAEEGVVDRLARALVAWA